MICCDFCPASYHMVCLSPPLTSLPKGDWKCQVCKLNSSHKSHVSFLPDSVLIISCVIQYFVCSSLSVLSKSNKKCQVCKFISSCQEHVSFIHDWVSPVIIASLLLTCQFSLCEQRNSIRFPAMISPLPSPFPSFFSPFRLYFLFFFPLPSLLSFSLLSPFPRFFFLSSPFLSFLFTLFSLPRSSPLLPLCRLFT